MRKYKYICSVLVGIIFYFIVILIIPPNIRVYFFPPRHIQYINTLFTSNYPINKKGITPLHIAAVNNDTTELGELLNNGADINVRAKNGNTPLISAAIYGSNKAFEYLIKNNANYTLKNKIPHLAIGYALANQNSSMILALVSSGYEINGSEEEYALINRVSKRNEDREIFELLINNGADVNTTNTYDNNSLLHGVVDTLMAQRILELGVSPNVQNIFGETPLHRARNLEIAKLLISKGADVNAISYKGETPLHTNSVPDVIDFLARNGADIDKLNKENKPPILTANFDHEIIPLVKNGADVFVTTLGGGTLLHKAKTANLAKLLIARGVPVNQEDSKGHTPLYYANRKLKYRKTSKSSSNVIEKYEKLVEVLKMNGGIIK